MNTQAHIHKIEIDPCGYGLIRYGDQHGAGILRTGGRAGISIGEHGC